MFEASHKQYLNRLDEVVVSVNFFEAPVGNGSCGRVGPLEKYTLPIEPVTFSTYIEPVAK